MVRFGRVYRRTIYVKAPKARALTFLWQRLREGGGGERTTVSRSGEQEERSRSAGGLLSRGRGKYLSAVLKAATMKRSVVVVLLLALGECRRAQGCMDFFIDIVCIGKSEGSACLFSRIG